MEQELLLPNTFAFDKSTLLDKSNQSFIDLSQNPGKENVEIFLYERAIPYLEKNLSNSVAENLFILIITCMDLYPDFVLPAFDMIFQKSQFNSNFVIITASIVSHFHLLCDKDSHKDVVTFIDNSLNQLTPQIKNKDQISFQLYNHTISNHFITKLISDLLLSTTLTKELVEDFYSYLFSDNTIQDKTISISLILKAIKSGLSSHFSHEVVNYICTEKIGLGLQIQDIVNILPKMTQKNFKSIFPIIEPLVIKSVANLSTEFIINFLDKCRISKLKIKSAGEFIQKLGKDQISIEIWEYLRNIRFKLPYDFVLNLIGTLDNNYIVKLIPSLKYYENGQLQKLILECDDFKAYDNLFYCKEVNQYSHLLKQDFWNHIFALSSPKKCRNSTAFKLAALFKNLGDEKVLKSTFKQMIFTDMPLKKNNINFLYKFESKLKRMKVDIVDESLAKEILEFYQQNKILPIPCFWKLIPKKILNEMVTQNPTPLLLYGYEFADDKFLYLHKSNEVTIIEQDEESLKQVLDFIQSKSLNSIINVNEKALSLITASFSFSNSLSKITVNGITKNNILLFFAVILKYSLKTGNKSLLPEIVPMICNAYGIANRKSPFFEATIDYILSFYLNLNVSSFKFSSLLDLIKNLTSLVCYDEFKDDKMSLLASIFRLLSEKEFNEIGGCFPDFTIDLIEYFIKNASNIHQNKEIFKPKSLCKSRIDTNELKYKLVEALNTSEPTEVIDLIYLIEIIFNFKINLQINDTTFLSKCIDYSIDNKKYDDIILIHQFIENQGLDGSLSVYRPEFPLEIRIQVLPEKFTIDESDADRFISLILNDENPEKNKVLYEGLFKFMMCEESTAINYYKSLFTNFENSNESISRDNLLKIYDLNHSDEFIDALNSAYELDEESSRFSKKIGSKETSFNDSKFGMLIISKLFDSIDQNKHQAFYALKFIASCFPFFFSQNPQQVIDAVLPVLLNEVPLFMNIQNEEVENENNSKFKTLISALSFFYSALHSIKVLDSFIDWFFTNLSTLNESVILAFISVLCSLDVKNEQRFLYSFVKHNLFENLQTLLNRRNNAQLTDRIAYLLNSYYLSLSKSSEYFRLIIDKLKDLQNPLIHAFDHEATQSKFNITPKSYLFFNKKNVKDSYSFMNEVNDEFDFYITKATENKEPISQLIATSFKQKIKEKISSTVTTNANASPAKLIEYPEVPEQLTLNMIRLIAFKPKWIFDYFCNNNKYVLYQKQIKALTKIVDKMKEIKEQDQGSDEEEYKNKLEEFDELQANILNTILKYYDKDNFILLKAADTSTKDDVADLSIRHIEIVSKIFDFFLKGEYSPYNRKYKDLVLSSSSSLFSNEKNLNDIEEAEELFTECIDKLLNVVFMPQFRDDTRIIKYVSSCLISLENHEVPIRATLLICFMLCFVKDKNKDCSVRDYLLTNALQLASKIKYEKLENSISFLEEIYDDSISDLNNLDMDKINKFMKYFPKITMTRKAETFGIIVALFKKIEDNMEELDPKDLETLSSFTQIIAPRRDSFDSKQISDSLIYNQGEKIHQHKNVLRPIPAHLIDSSPFWKLLDEHYDTLSRIYLEINEDKKKYKNREFYDYFNFLLDYPEIVDFDTRMKYFRRHISNLRKSYSIRILVKRSDIIKTSYEQIKDKDKEALFHHFTVNFDDEKGTDQGGLFNDWLTNLIRELLNPKSKLFEYTDTHCCYPSRNAVDEEKLKYINFAGKMIGYALLHNVNIGAHLAPFFFKTILHHKLELKDMKSYSEAMYNSYQNMLCNDVNGINYAFVAGYLDENGEYKEVALPGGGPDVEVTNDNKSDFINKQYKFYIVDSIKKQSEAFCNGFDSIVPHKYLRIFSQGELELLICGLPTIDVDDMRKNIELEGYSIDSPTIEMFFNVISKWSDEMKAGLLQFISGNSMVPLDGFKDKKITIQRLNDTDSLPKAHTCSSTIELPPYEDEKKMHEKLETAVLECNTFGFS